MTCGQVRLFFFPLCDFAFSEFKCMFINVKTALITTNYFNSIVYKENII